MKIALSFVLVCVFGAVLFWGFSQAQDRTEGEGPFYSAPEENADGLASAGLGGKEMSQGNRAGVAEAGFSGEPSDQEEGPAIKQPEGEREDWNKEEWEQFHLSRYLDQFLQADTHDDQWFAAKKLNRLSIASILNAQNRALPEGSPLTGIDAKETLQLNGVTYAFDAEEFPEFNRVSAIMHQAKETLQPGEVRLTFDAELTQAIIDRALQAARVLEEAR